ncbi:unnamed protein product, partial [Ixodes hexagonus]
GGGAHPDHCRVEAEGLLLGSQEPRAADCGAVEGQHGVRGSEGAPGQALGPEGREVPLRAELPNVAELVVTPDPHGVGPRFFSGTALGLS